MMPAYTHDWLDTDINQLVQVAENLEADPLDLAGCWMSESGLHSTAHNANGNAAGLFQAMPSTLTGLHYPWDWRHFVNESVSTQLTWAEKYYMPHKGQLVNPAACYLATFLPAFMPHAGEMAFVLCGKNGPHEEWYSANHVALDVNGDGFITIQDLADRIDAVCTGPRWAEFATRVRAAMEPEPVACDDLPDVNAG